LSDEDYEKLKAIIKEQGQLVPIWLNENKIINGHHRFEACQNLGLEIFTQEWNGKGSLVEFVTALNMNRRHMTKGDLIEAALKLVPALAAKAKELQRLHGGTAPGKPAITIGLTSAQVILKERESQTTDKVAGMPGIGKSLVSDAIRIEKVASERLEEIK